MRRISGGNVMKVGPMVVINIILAGRRAQLEPDIVDLGYGISM